MKEKKTDFQFLYPIESFGIRQISLSGIRVEWLANRLTPNVPFPHKHNFYQIIIINKGNGSHQIDFTKHQVKKKHIFIMKPGQVHSWNFPKDIEAYVIDFSFQSFAENKENTLERWSEINALSDSIKINANVDFDSIFNLAEIMYSEFQNEEIYYSRSLKNLLSSLLIKLIRIDQNKVRDTHTNKIARPLLDHFYVLVEKNYKSHHNVKFYSDSLGQPPKTLSMAISRATGLSPHQIIHNRIVLEAKRLLAFSTKSISEISYELGFNDYSYFSRFFKKHNKLTPADFRKKL